MAGALQLLLLDLLLDEVLRRRDGRDAAADGHDAVARARGEGALLRDLDVGARHLLDLHQASPAGTCTGRHCDRVTTRITLIYSGIENERNIIFFKS